VYRELITDFADWVTDERQIEDAAERDQFRRLIEGAHPRSATV
jgi:hypothetical protein